MKYILYIEDHNGQSKLEFNSLKTAKDELATRISLEKSSGSSVIKNSDDDYSIRNYWRGNTHMYIKKAPQPTKIKHMKICNLKQGCMFQFPKGKSTYVILSIENNDFVGWIVNFVNTNTGQKYQYQQPAPSTKGNDPTQRQVVLLKENVIKTSKKYITKEDVEKTFNIKITKNTFVK